MQKKKRKSAPATTGKRYFGVRLDRALIARLRACAAYEQRTLGVVLSRILNESLTQLEAAQKAEKEKP